MTSVSQRSVQSSGQQRLSRLPVCGENQSLHHVYRPKLDQLFSVKISLIPRAVNMMTIINTQPSYACLSISILLYFLKMHYALQYLGCITACLLESACRVENTYKLGLVRSKKVGPPLFCCLFLIQ